MIIGSSSLSDWNAQLKAQLNVPPLQSGYSDYCVWICTTREMTPEDLGLITTGQDRYKFRSLFYPDTDAPYAFWLGANANGVEWHRLAPREPFEASYCAKHDNLYATVCRACEP